MNPIVQVEFAGEHPGFDGMPFYFCHSLQCSFLSIRIDVVTYKSETRISIYKLYYTKHETHEDAARHINKNIEIRSFRTNNFLPATKGIGEAN